MKIKDLNNTIINAMIQTGTVVDCKEGYMEITQQSLSEPTLTISVPSTVTVGTPTTITVTASVVGDITVYINQEYYQTSIGQSTMSFTYTPEDTFTIEAYFSSTQGISVNASQEIIPEGALSFAVQSFDPIGDNYNPVFQQYLYEVEGISANAEYTTTEEAEVVTSFINRMSAEQIQSITSLDELENFTNLTNLPDDWLNNNVSGVATVYAKRLQSVKFPESLTTIGENAFASSSLTSLNLPQSLTNVNMAFNLCPLTHINIPASIIDTIGVIGYSVYGVYDTNLTYNIIEPTLVSVNNSNNGYTINDGILYWANVPLSIFTLTPIINIPDNIMDITPLYTMYKGIQQFTCSDTQNSIYCTDGVVFRKDTNDLVLFPTDYQSNTYTPPIGCSAIGRVSYEVTIKVDRLIIGSNILNVNLKHIGNTLELNSNIQIPQGANNYIQTEARTIIIGNNVTSIPVYFNRNTDIAPLTIDCYCYAITPPTIYSYTFRISNSSTLYVPYASLSAYQSSEWSNYFSNILPIQAPVTYAVQSTDPSGANYNPVFQEWLYNNGIASNSGYTTMEEALNLTAIPSRAFDDNVSLTHMDELRYFTNLITIGDNAFDDCSSLISIIIPSSVTSIGSAAFFHCSVLTSVEIPNGVTSIGNRAFLGCTGLTSVTIPNSITSIKLATFESCTGLTSITIPNSVTSIEDNAFYNCEGLTSVTIPNSVTSIGYQTFRYCEGLTSVTIPNSVTSIGNRAFWGCVNLSKVYCNAINPPSIEILAFENDENIDLYVPSASVSAYRNASGWDRFRSYNAIQ